MVLWSLSGPITVFGITIPGYMVWVALIYAVVGTWLAHLIGRPLIRLNFNQQKVEADFRYALVRFRENVEGIALHGGEADEKRGLLTRFRALMENWWSHHDRHQAADLLHRRLHAGRGRSSRSSSRRRPISPGAFRWAG